MGCAEPSLNAQSCFEIQNQAKWSPKFLKDLNFVPDFSLSLVLAGWQQANPFEPSYQISNRVILHWMIWFNASQVLITLL